MMDSKRPTRIRVVRRLFALFGLMASSLWMMGANAQAGKPPRVLRGPARSTAEPAPAPSNLKVLPGRLTGAQVRTIMDQWNAELGMRCEGCHVAESDGVARGAGPELRYADDSKPMEQAARLMYSMTVEINRKFIVGDDAVPGPVTCGTCHRGRVKPEPFLPPRVGPGLQTTASVPARPHTVH